MADKMDSSHVSIKARAAPTNTSTSNVEQSSNNAKLHSSSLKQSSERLELAFQNLTYQVKLKSKYRTPGGPKEKKILSGITGIFRPGRLAAIMGSSGAGKTTLLLVLAGYAEEGAIEGNILVNGEPYSGKSLRDVSGFVFQDDLLLESMKVREAIAMSALLRLPKSVNKEEQRRRVNETLGLMHLEKAQDTIVGSPLQKGISGGERKRTAIGMEMVVNPAMLFLDEPTTGLDAFTALTVVLSLKGLARQGRTIIATIHQPSTEIFNIFDDLVIMSRGRIAYFGPVKHVIAYFARQGYRCPQYSNPADYLFMDVLREFGTIDEEDSEEEQISGRTTPLSRDNVSSLENSLTDRSNNTVFGDSESERRAAGTGLVAATRPSNHSLNSSTLGESSNTPQELCDRKIEGLISAWSNSPEQATLIKENQTRPKVGVAYGLLRQQAPLHVQFVFLFARATKSYIRNTQLIIARLFQSIFIGVVLGLIYLKTNDYDMTVQIQNKSGALYFIAVNAFFAASSEVLAIFGVEKQVFYREYRAGYYSIGPYYISKTLVEMPGTIIAPYLMIIIAYYMIGLTPAFSSYLFIATLAALGALCGHAYGTLIASIFDDVNIALIVAPLCILPFVAVSGIFVAALPVYINWLKYCSPIYYSFSGMLQTQFPNGELKSTELSFESTFSAGVDVAFLCGLFLIVWVAGFMALWYGAWRKR